MPLEQIDLLVHVEPTNFLGEPASVGVTITLPEPDRMPQRPIVCFARTGRSASQSGPDDRFGPVEHRCLRWRRLCLTDWCVRQRADGEAAHHVIAT